ncbi:Highly reducing polyketide synthase FUM1 [Lachnellula cervina]|uniref:Highly reducing polyketide synthase FUM1 n=1 Tax=Lachnellula cervina TaxID=1316786 RepID=A0A7D8UV89_9HELO|nr:Highly reducing polyketide synthase FUM1 [Lachnellula cervina]
MHQNALLNIDDRAILAEPEFSQPMCTAIQIPLVDFLQNWGWGNCCYICGWYSHNEGSCHGRFLRGYVSRKSTMRGGMAAVGLGRDKVQPYLPPGVRIACENSGQNVTVNGDVKPLKKVMSQIKTDFPDTFIRKLLVKMTYYSHQMEQI